MMIRLYRDLRALVALANTIAAQNPGDAPRWSLFVTNRSFLALVVAVALNIAAVVGIPLAGWLAGIAPEVVADHAVEIATLLLTIWAAAERLAGKTRVIWNRKQAAKAVEEAQAPNTVEPDALAKALAEAGVK